MIDAWRNSVTMAFRTLPAGQFVMGRDDSWGNERPPHLVRLTTGFSIGLFPVTQKEFTSVTGLNPSRFNGSGLAPVESVTWDEALEFCRLLGDLPAERAAGRSYRLPTEAEWEYVCRAGSKTRWFFGNDENLVGAYAWTEANAGCRTHPVGGRLPNPFGIFDMIGNVWEWCADWYAEYSTGKQADPSGPTIGETRVIRGGGWQFGLPDHCSSAHRYHLPPASRSDAVGFRVVSVGLSKSLDADPVESFLKACSTDERLQRRVRGTAQLSPAERLTGLVGVAVEEGFAVSIHALRVYLVRLRAEACEPLGSEDLTARRLIPGFVIGPCDGVVEIA